jgi:hypothetical protein
MKIKTGIKAGGNGSCYKDGPYGPNEPGPGPGDGNVT